MSTTTDLNAESPLAITIPPSTTIAIPNTPSTESAGPLTKDVTVGGINAHYMRRIHHVSFFVSIPTIYYYFAEYVNPYLDYMTLPRIFSCLAILWMILEVIRIKYKITFSGLRTYEADRVSAQCWGTVSLLLCMVIAPSQNYVGIYRGSVCIPIVACLGVVDPLSGELKFRSVPKSTVAIISLFIAYLFYFLSVGFLQLPWWLAIILGPMSVICEQYSLEWLDDNGAMILGPLLVSLLFAPFYDPRYY